MRRISLVPKLLFLIIEREGGGEIHCMGDSARALNC